MKDPITVIISVALIIFFILLVLYVTGNFPGV